MPNIKTVSVTYGRKFNLGDYNSANISITLWADVDEDECLNTVMCDLWEMAANNVRAKALPLLKKPEAQTEEIFLGLPVELQQSVKGCTCTQLGALEPTFNPDCPIHGALYRRDHAN